MRFSRLGVSFISVNVMSMRLASIAGSSPLNGIGINTIGLPICFPSAAARSTITPCSVVPSDAYEIIGGLFVIVPARIGGPSAALATPEAPRNSAASIQARGLNEKRGEHIV